MEVGKNKGLLSHLQFFDDTIFFYSSEESFWILNHILAFFETVLGLKIDQQRFVLFSPPSF